MDINEAPFSWNCNLILNIFSVYNELAVLTVDTGKEIRAAENNMKMKNNFLCIFIGIYLHPASVHI